MYNESNPSCFLSSVQTDSDLSWNISKEANKKRDQPVIVIMFVILTLLIAKKKNLVWILRGKQAG